MLGNGGMQGQCSIVLGDWERGEVWQRKLEMIARSGLSLRFLSRYLYLPLGKIWAFCVSVLRNIG